MKTMVMIPTYNERDNLPDLIQVILAQPVNLEIVIVDDNSPDGTGQLADALATRDTRVHVIHRRSEKGRASAGLAGFEYALQQPDVDFIVEMDADFSHNPNDIPRLVEAAQQCDVAIGSRYVPGGRQVNCTPRNVAFSRIINLVNRVWLGLKVKDSSGGFKCYRKHVLQTIRLDEFISKEYSVGAEILLRCQNNGFTFKEIPIIFQNRTRGTSKANLKVMIEYPLSLLRLRIRSLSGKLL